MGVEELVSARDALPATERASAVQVVVGEAAADQGWNADLGECWDQGAPPVVAQRVAALLRGELVAQPHPAQCESERPDEAVLANAPRPHHVPVRVSESLPGGYRLEARRSQRRRLPLRDGKVGHAEHASGAGAPRLCGGPFDQVVDILALLVRPDRAGAFRSPGAAQVAVDDRVALPGPPGRVGRLPPGQRREPHPSRLPEHPVLNRHPVPSSAPPRQVVLAIGVRRQQRGERPVTGRQDDVDPERRAVPHGHRQIPQHCQRPGLWLVDVHRRPQQPRHPTQRVPRRTWPPPRLVRPGLAHPRGSSAHGPSFPARYPAAEAGPAGFRRGPRPARPPAKGVDGPSTTLYGGRWPIDRLWLAGRHRVGGSA